MPIRSNFSVDTTISKSSLAGLGHLIHTERKTISFHKEGGYPGTVERLTLKVVSKSKGAYWVSVDGAYSRIKSFMSYHLVPAGR